MLGQRSKMKERGGEGRRMLYMIDAPLSVLLIPFTTESPSSKNISNRNDCSNENIFLLHSRAVVGGQQYPRSARSSQQRRGKHSRTHLYVMLPLYPALSIHTDCPTAVYRRQEHAETSSPLDSGLGEPDLSGENLEKLQDEHDVSDNHGQPGHPDEDCSQPPSSDEPSDSSDTPPVPEAVGEHRESGGDGGGEGGEGGGDGEDDEESVGDGSEEGESGEDDKDVSGAQDAYGPETPGAKGAEGEFGSHKEHSTGADEWK